MKILINRSDAIGDVILTMPMAKLIKDKLPDAEVTFIVSPKCADLFINHPYIDNYWILDHNQSVFKKLRLLWKRMREFKADCYFHVGGSHLPTFVSWLQRIKVRGGLKSKWQTFTFLNNGIRQKRSLVEMHESEYNLNLLSPLNIEYHYSSRNELAPIIHLQEDEKKSAYDQFVRDVIEEKITYRKQMIFIHPGMMGHTLNWSSRNYARLIGKVEEKFPGKFLFVVSHTPADKKYLEVLQDELSKESFDFVKDKVFFFDGAKRGLRNYMAVLSKCEVFIGPSTGTTHIANALGVKQIAIYSPIKVQSSMRWGPFHRLKHLTKVIVPDVVCGEQFYCAKDSCKYYDCMAKIEVEEVYQSIVDLLGPELKEEKK